MSTLKVDNIASTSGVTNNRVLQVVQTIDSSLDFFGGSAGGGVFVDYDNLDTTITPVASDSKFLISFDVKIGAYGGSRRVVLFVDGTARLLNTVNTSSARYSSSASIYADGNPSDATFFSHVGQYLYTHSGSSSFNISFQIHKQNTNGVYVNRAYSYFDDNRGVSSSILTVMEFAT